VVAVRVAREHGIERRLPRVERDAELTGEGVVSAECALGDFSEDRALRPARDVGQGRPLADPPLRVDPAPSHSPDAHVLDAPGVLAGTNDVVADLRIEAARRLRGDRDDQELGNAHVAQVLQEAPELRGERPRVERRRG
jgi:hypothetical protein